MKAIFISALIILSFTLSAQPWKSATIVTEDNFYAAQKQFHDHWKNKKISLKEEENAKEGGYQQFARWEHFMETRAYPTGRIPNPDILLNEYVRTKAVRQGSQRVMGQGMDATAAANWTFVGPPVVPASGGGAGRINCIAIHPTSPNIMYVGAAAGGVWKTTNGGTTWSSSTDQLASISVADIAINPQNPSTIYVATGDGYGYEYGGWFWGGTYTAGVMKSTDAGLTWTQSGLTYSQTQTDIIQRLIINPQNPAILLACTRNAIFRTTDSATTWTLVRSGHFYDMEFNTHNPNTVYASDSSQVYRSLDGGASFAPYSNSLNGGSRISIAVTPADTMYMYAFTTGTNFYRSTNGGQTFTLMTSPGGSFYGYYDCVLAVSPTNKNRVLTGGTNVFKTDDGGSTWTTNANTGAGTYVHADNHALTFFPNSNISYLSGNDGGLFKTTNSGSAWTDLSNGLAIKQYYRISSSEINPDLYYGGAQDNGTDQLFNNVWTQVYGADGMDCMTDYNDENTAYVSSQYGNFSITTDGGLTFTGISPGSGDWVTPIAQDPADPNTIYIGGMNLFKSIDKGTTWNTIYTNFQSNIQKISIAPSDHNYIYACNISEIYRTVNGGTSWINIASGLPTSLAAMTGIAVCSSNPLKVWVTFSDYSSGNKVFKSVNGGNTWTNVSGTLPNIPVDCIVYQRNTNDQIYIGTDFGVYYRDSSLTDWVPYQTGLPNVIVDDLKINYTASKLRAGTYGRGIWQTDLNTSTFYQIDAGVRTITIPYFACSDTISPSVLIKNFGQDTLFSFQLNYKIDNGTVITQPWSGVLVPAQSTTVSISPIAVAGGIHTFTAYTSNPNGSTDANPSNDQKVFSFEIDNTILSAPVTEGFEADSLPVADWRVLGTSLYSVQPYGGFGNSSFSLMADFYSTSAGQGNFTSKRINLTNAVSPVRLDFNLAYAEYSPSYRDSLCISASTDCGGTWVRMYLKSGTALSTRSDTAGIFYPTASDWRAESVNLNPWIGYPEVMVRFEAISGYGNNLFIDDINLHYGPNSVSEAFNADGIHVFPVPFRNTLDINAGSEMISYLQLTDVTGKLVASESNVNAYRHSLTTSNLSDGIYFLKVITATGSFVKKVVKQ